MDSATFRTGTDPKHFRDGNFLRHFRGIAACSNFFIRRNARDPVIRDCTHTNRWCGEFLLQNSPAAPSPITPESWCYPVRTAGHPLSKHLLSVFQSLQSWPTRTALGEDFRPAVKRCAASRKCDRNPLSVPIGDSPCPTSVPQSPGGVSAHS
jgi:hypothetical protein